MSLDYLQSIIAVEEAWEPVKAIVWQRINQRLMDLHVKSRSLLPIGRIPAGLTFDVALSRLKKATHRLKNFVDDTVPWLVLGRMTAKLCAQFRH